MSAYLIRYNRISGSVELLRFRSLAEATRERLRLDKLNHDPNIEIVAVSSRDEESLRRSHSRYFSAIS